MAIGIIDEETRKRLAKNAERYQKKVELNKPIEAKEFRLNPDGSECDDETYMERCNLLRFLKNDHYTNWQIRLFKSLIIKGDSYEKITRLFTPEASAEEIEEYLRETKIKV